MGKEVCNTEQRSEKVRQFIGDRPSGIIRYGTLFILLIDCIFLLVSFYMPYSVIINTNAIALDSKFIEIECPYDYYNRIKEGMEVNVVFEGYDSGKNGYTVGVVSNIDKNLKTNSNGNYFLISVRIETYHYNVVKGMVGKANILITYNSILKRILNDN